MLKKDYINLNRTFYELSRSTDPEDDVYTREMMLSLQGYKATNWDDLLKQYRVVILAEAGAGKTTETKQAARKVRSEGKDAFFLRLEHITDDLESAFEVGTFPEFQAWLVSTNEGWIFLDSVDEARLKHPKDFDQAIRKISVRLNAALQRVHIVITGRTHAWRSHSDLNLCNEKFPLALVNGHMAKEEEKNDKCNCSDDFLGNMEAKSVRKVSKISTEKDESIFKVYSLWDLSPAQAEVFLQGKGIADTSTFLKEVERRDAWSFLSRPQDLEETLGFWNKQARLGSPLELMRHSIKYRLKEHDPNRAEVDSLTTEEANKGARIVAAAAILAHESTIRVPGGSSGSGINIKSILTDWTDKKCSMLLSLPIFDEAIYGTVRFHHRTVREYLAAEWFSEILKQNGSRKRVERIFFREQYGMQVIRPSMRPVLAWLALLDDKIKEKALEIEPEVILEGGDPSQLPLHTRKEILSVICKKMAARTSSESISERASVQRFASPDMTDDIKRLIKEYENDENLIFFLLRMVQLGNMKDALPEAKRFACDPQGEQYTRMAAIKAVQEIGSAEDYKDLLKKFASESGLHDRGILADLVEGIASNSASVEWVIKAVSRSESKEQYGYDDLSPALIQFIDRLSLDDTAKLLDGFGLLLDEEPMIETHFHEVSERFSWLISCCLSLLEKLIVCRHDAALNDTALSVLIKSSACRENRDSEYGKTNADFAQLVRSWPELNRLLFWKDVDEIRKSTYSGKDKQLREYRRVAIFGCRCWEFNTSHFDAVLQDVAERELLDDRLVALSLAFEIYKSNGSPKEWQERLKKLARKESDLEQALKILFRPSAQSQEHKRLARTLAAQEKKSKTREEKRQKYHEEWAKWLAENFEKLREREGDTITNAQYYLHEEMRKYSGNSSRWTEGNWRDLSQEFSSEIVDAFREGMVKYWRLYTPVLLSEGGDKRKTSFTVIFGLTSLVVEADEAKNWAKSLRPEDVEIACRYAFHELNGFPRWFQKLYEACPDIVIASVLREINWELDVAVAHEERHYILGKIGWGCDWIWDGIAMHLFDKLKKEEPKNSGDLKSILNIVQGSSVVPDRDLAGLASEKCADAKNSHHLGLWFPTWIGVDPNAAIKSLSDNLKSLSDGKLATELTMEISVNLLGDRRFSSYVRDAHKTPEHLKELYLLMHRYIRQEDDVIRIGNGPYSPQIRDDAQDVRSKAFSILSDIPGKESFLAIMDLSELHPVEISKVWMLRAAKKRAENDADAKPILEGEFSEFGKTLEFTPANHKELFDLVIIHLEDLKDDLENGDSSVSSILKNVEKETEIRKYIGNWCREKAVGKYSVPQEEELADAKRPDIRFHGATFDAPVPVELKLADNWSGNDFFERLENQLCGDYLRDGRSNCGVFLLVYRGKKNSWQTPTGEVVDFRRLVLALQNYGVKLSSKYSKVDKIAVLGIDLTKRMSKVESKLGNKK